MKAAAKKSPGANPKHSNPASRFATWPIFSEDEIAAASRALASGRVNYWTGDQGAAFEREFAQATGTKYAVAVANGSVALELALHALGIGPGDEVIVPSRSFVASASCVLLRGARPVFAEVDRDSGNLTAETLRARISPGTRAAIVVHLGGWPCEMAEIMELAHQHQLKIIEDCAQAQGASYRGQPVGSFGHAAAFSFCQDKIMTTGGEGGMLASNDQRVFERAWSYKDHGKNLAARGKQDSASGFRWLHDSPGTNWRLTEMQSAMGRVMLPKIAARIAQRRRNAGILRQALAEVSSLRLPQPPEHMNAAFYRSYAYLRPEKLLRGWTRDRVLEEIRREGVPCSVGGCGEIYLEQAFAPEMRPPQRFPVARELAETSLAFLAHHTLDEGAMREVAGVVKTALYRMAGN